MTYKIARDGQEFGPYSLSDIQRYVGTGNILLTDLALAEGSTEWVPVSQVVGTIAVPPAAPAGFGTAATYSPVNAYPDPPNLHWGLVLLFGFLTCGIFIVVWDFVQASWMKKVQPETKALMYYIIALVLYGGYILISFGNVFFTAMNRNGGEVNTTLTTLLGLVGGLLSLAYLVMILVARFTMRSSLEKHFNAADPVGLSLSGVMTFFFGCLYFQYHLNRINEIKQAYRMGNRL